MSDPHGTPAFDRRLAELARSAAAVARPESPAAVRLRAGRRTVRRRIGTGALAVAVLGAVVAGGVLRPSFRDDVPPAVTPSPVTPPSSTPTPTMEAPSVTASPPSPAGTVGARPPDPTPGRCTTANLTVTLGSPDAASGHRSVAVVFRNSGSTSCRLTGYPGVDALGGDGRTLAHAERTPRGYLGGAARGARPPTVTLRPGGVASALVEAQGFRADGGPCTAYVRLLVTPPDDVRSVRLGWDTDSCGELEVHPVVPGVTGRSG
ncbi:DUF4232 domain-containing protein [Micromonospora orduensis]|uniref:DUF4232 domain-containing protein n=1 Tax=Micromonospora orduensis TaxID=1420891 RepID=A0A5C4QR28_9ACTN|nr:DUF4232 domain-containing protein [Micromonospora orduensis]TNH26830.1 DUF4232 domain-containing protein [Micromonospora orduensis]